MRSQGAIRALALIFVAAAIWSMTREAAAREPPNFAQNWSPPAIINSAAYPSGRPHLLTLNDGRKLMTFFVNVGNTNYIAFRVTYADGAWSPTGVIPGSQGGLDPSAAQLPDGQLVIAYARYLLPYPHCLDQVSVFLTSSPDLVSWSAPEPAIAAQPNRIDTNAFAPSILALDNSHILIAYAYGRERNPGPNPGVADVWLARLTRNPAGGFELEQRSSLYANPDPGIYDSRPSIIRLGNGELLCALYSSQPGGTELTIQGRILAVRSTNGGLSWDSPRYIDSGQGSYYWPFLIERPNGEVWCAFTKTETSDPASKDAGFFKTADRGVTWTDEEMLGAQPGIYEGWPALCQDQDGSVTAVWDNGGWSGADVWQVTTTRTREPIVSIVQPAMMAGSIGTSLSVDASPLTERTAYYLDGDAIPFAIVSAGSGLIEYPERFATDLPEELPPGLHEVEAVAYSDGKTGTSHTAVTVPEMTVTLERSYWASYSDFVAHTLTAGFHVTNRSAADMLAVVKQISTGGRVAVLTPTPLLVSESLPGGSAAPFQVQYRVPAGILWFAQALTLTPPDVSTT